MSTALPTLAPAFIAFMCHLPESEYDFLESTLQEYNIHRYLIGYEASPYSHYHVLVQMTNEDYHRFAERVFRKKFKLRGKAINGNPRQYGKIKKIDDLEKMKSYTVKDGNYRSNMPESEVQQYFANSFKKEEKKKMYQEIFEHCEQQFILEGELPDSNKYAYTDEQHYDQYPQLYSKCIKIIKTYIINYLRIYTDINMCRSNIMSYTQYFIKHTKQIESDTKKNNLIYHLLF